MDLFSVTVPPLRRLTDAVPRLLSRFQHDSPLRARLAADGMAGGEHFCVALGYVARTVLPLTGQAVPDQPCAPDRAVILALAVEMRALLSDLTPENFAGAETRQISHAAGEARLTQSGTDYALLYALPNAQFHLTLGYATLRMTGVLVGKGDLDGFHRYAPGTNFAASAD
ncbi:DUF1993 family protein [uncultured Tateyamaria sp.]|uniref:DUF1993 family protein n=1 Tax=Tateyamaria sp. 1078 TaxID=3417464 RepID=UPI0026341798|nr:DUF1993 family protein [uncultured Tateyamaria sp.]